MARFAEVTRVQMPATIHFLRLGYAYQSLKDVVLHKETRIALNRMKPALERINCRVFTDEEIYNIAEDIHAVIRNNDLGKAFHQWLTHPADKVRLIDFENPENNDFAVIDELTFGRDGDESTTLGSFRPDINIFINGIPLAFLEVKPPNNDGGIQAEFDRMLNKRLERPEYQKYFNMLQIVSFSNNMEYEESDDLAFAEDVKAGSFYTTPNGFKTTFSFFREEQSPVTTLLPVSHDKMRFILKDNGLSPTELESAEFQTNLDPDTPCNRFVTSLFTKERLLYLIQYGMMFLNGAVPEKHIMRYPQFFASRALTRCLERGEKSGIIWHTQGSGKTNLAALATRILRDFYAKRGITARLYYVVDRLDLLTQVQNEMTKRGINVIQVSNRQEFERELNKPISNRIAMDTDGEITVVNIQKFTEDMPVAQNEYNANVQRIIFVDEAHRSYKSNGEFLKNLMMVDPNAVYVALTGTPLLSKKERSNLKFGDYIHKYFYDKSIADGYTLRIKKESIETTARAAIKKNLEFENPRASKADVYESDEYISALCEFIEKDFSYFRYVNSDDSIGGMIVCASNAQAKKIKAWFDKRNQLQVGLVITDESITSEANKKTQLSFKEELRLDLLVVHQMLTTGYDVNRLKKMYLLRNAKEHTLLQTISRVNRPYKSKTGQVYRYGYIVDFVDIAEEYDRTIEMYLKEIEEDFQGEGDVSGLLVNAETIYDKYKKYQKELDDIIDTANLELFNKRLTLFSMEALRKLRNLLKNIKACRTELLLSHATQYAAEIDVDRVNQLINIVQKRIDFMNLKSAPTNLLSVLSNKEVVDILYEFFKTKIEIIDLSKLTRAMKELTDSDEYAEMTRLVAEVQEELKRNQNKSQIEMVKLDEILRQLFEDLDIDSLASINSKLLDVLQQAREINETNILMSQRYGGNFAFVKTYTDAKEIRPDVDGEAIAKTLDVLFAVVQEIQSANILMLQSRTQFIATMHHKTTVPLTKSGLYDDAQLDDWYDDLLAQLHANLKIF